MEFSLRSRVVAVAAAAAFAPTFSAPAQVSMQFHFGEDAYHRIDGRHPLQGRQYQTMATLAHMLDETAQDLNRQAYRASRGEHGQVRLLASVSDFARRAADFHNRMDGYLDSPWNIGREVDDLTRRARQVNGAITNARLFPGTTDMWIYELDILGRMQRLTRGENVGIPAVAVHPREERDGWDHRDFDRQGWPDQRPAEDGRPDDRRPDPRDNNGNPTPR